MENTRKYIHNLPEGNSLLTPQEHMLIGSNLEEGLKWYIPVDIQRGNKGIEEVNRLRKENPIMQGIILYFLNEDGSDPDYSEMYAELELASLDLETGESISDPKPINKKLRYDLSEERLNLRI